MQSITANRLDTLSVRGEALRALGRLYYLAGKQTTGAEVHRDLYEDLRQDVIVQGTRSSNRIEGIEVPESRYQPIMRNEVPPEGHAEKLLIGYRDALDFIHHEWRQIEVTPETLGDLHRRIHARVGERAGEYRLEHNQIEREEGEVKMVVYVPPPASQVARLCNGLCLEYNRLHGEKETDEFLLMAGFILDFTCIHPFMDGNGRVSRLLTTLLAYKAGFEVVRYISHEKLVDESKRGYYYALTESSRDWQRGAHRWTPWLAYLANIFIRSYDELARRIDEGGKEKGYQSRRIKEVIRALPSRFTIRDIFDLAPSATRPTVNRVLAEMKDLGEIETMGAGPLASYRKRSVLDGLK